MDHFNLLCQNYTHMPRTTEFLLTKHLKLKIFQNCFTCHFLRQLFFKSRNCSRSGKAPNFHIRRISGFMSGGSNIFVSTKIYRRLVGHHIVHDSYRWLWKCQCQPKHEVFLWLLISDRLSTRNLLRRRGMDLDSFTCVFCLSLQEETVHHLFVDCAFTKLCWSSLNIDIPLGAPFPDLAWKQSSSSAGLFGSLGIIGFSMESSLVSKQ